MDRYKVVLTKNIEKGIYWSCIVSRDSVFNLIYKLHKTTWAPIGTIGILIFDDLLNARSFAHSYVIPFRPLPFVTVVLKGKTIDEYECSYINTTEAEYLKGLNVTTAYPPVGTMRCAGFVPIDAVDISL